MGSLQKTLLSGIAVGALLVGVFIESFNYIAARNRSQITQELQKVLGNDVSFESFEVNLWGRPGFVATDFRIADDNRFAATPALRARELIFGVSLWNLLRGRLVITSLSFIQPDFQVITNEEGRVNLTALIERKTELRKFPRLRAGSADRNGLPISFAVDELAVTQGRIDYIDRSVRQPAELQIRNVSMRIDGFQPDQATRIHIGASLTRGLLQDVRVRGEIAGASEGGTWLQRAVDLNVQIDSLHVPVVARAIAVLRDRIPSELDVTGPMALEMTARGTFEQPRLEDVTLKVPLFGSTEYNAVINGRIKFNERRSWEEAELAGTLVIDPLSPNRLRSFAVFENLIPESVSTEGGVRITSRFEGTWEELRIGALVLGDKIDVRYKNWLHKPAETPATIRARMTKSKQRFVVHPSELDVGAQKLNFSGRVEYQSQPLLHLSIAASGALANWTRFLGVPGWQATAGKADVDVTARKSLSARNGSWDVRGFVKLDRGMLRHAASGRSLDDLQGQIVFDGPGARVQNGRARLGKSTILVDGGIAELGQPRFKTVFKADHLDLRDLPGLHVGAAARLKAVTGDAEVALDGDRWLLIGSLTAPEATVNNWPLRSVRGNIEWDSAGLKLSDVQAQAYQGVLRAEGFLPGSAGETRPFLISGQIENMDLRSMLVHWFPPLRDRVEGRFSGAGRFEAAGLDAAGGKDTFGGGGQAEIRNGTIRNFNLASQLLLKGSDSMTPPSSLSRIPPGFTALLQRRDTSLDSATATFRVEQDRLFSDDLVITTADYTITGAGWLGLDRSTRWNGMLVLSPRLTQEFQREYRGLRYVVDRRGRLAIEFRVDGQIQSPSIRLENRALAQALGFGSGPKGGDGAGGNSSKPRKNWIPDALERYLNR